MKDYSFEEVIANIKQGETYKCTSNIYVIQTIHRNEIGLKFNDYKPLDRCGTNDIQRFVKVETPVSFQEIMAKDNILCRVEHEHMDGWLSYQSLQKSKEYLEFNQLMELLSEIPADELKVVLKYGRWYLKEIESK